MFALKLMAGCGGGDIETYSAAELVINIGINKQFAIDLGSNHTTGHGWQESYDESFLELTEKS